MEVKAEDYYDLPLDMLPSANFAGRPLSDISMLDGLWTSPSSSEDEEDVKGPNRKERNSSQATASISARLTRGPDIRISSPSSDDRKPLLRSLSNDVKTLERPRLMKKANTAPSSTTSSLDAATIQPVRAMSARRGKEEDKGKNITQSSHRRGDNGTGRKTTEKSFSDAKSSLPRKPLPPVPGQEDAVIVLGVGKKTVPGSFSKRLRIQKALKQNQIRPLETNLVNHRSTISPNSANSMLSTPRELYAIPEKQAAHDGGTFEPQVVHGAQPNMGSSRARERRSTKSPWSCVAPSLLQASTSLRGATNVNTELMSRPRRIYVSGTIRLEEHQAAPRRGSVATPDPLESPDERVHQFSDMTVEEATLMFFDNLGVLEDVSEASLDRYWLEGVHTADSCEQDAWRRPNISSVTEPSPPMAHDSRFSFSSASSVGKSARTRLGRLLSPTRPGTALLKTPGIFEKQARRWQGRHDTSG